MCTPVVVVVVHTCSVGSGLDETLGAERGLLERMRLEHELDLVRVVLHVQRRRLLGARTRLHICTHLIKTELLLLLSWFAMLCKMYT